MPGFVDPTHRQPTSNVHWKQDLAYKVGFLDSSRLLWYLKVRRCNSLLVIGPLEGEKALLSPINTKLQMYGEILQFFWGLILF